MPWSELERRLSWGKAVPGPSHQESRRRQPYEPPPAVVRRQGAVPYAELHCHTNFSFLDGASHREELVEEAARLGLEALAVTDHDGMYGVVRFAEAAAAVGLPTVFGAELTLDLPRRSQAGRADPEGRHLAVLARDPDGYARLCRAISGAQLAGGEKGLPKASLSALAQAHGGHWLVLTGCRKGTVPAALATAGPAAAGRELADLVAAFGPDNVVVELWDHGDPLDSVRNDALVALAAHGGVDVVATNNVHYATPAHRPPVLGRRAGPSVRPLPGRCRAGGRGGSGVRLRPAPGGAQPPRLPGAARAHGDDVAAPAHLRGCAPALRPA